MKSERILEVQKKVISIPLCSFCIKHAEEAANIIADRYFRIDDSVEVLTIRFFSSSIAKCMCEVQKEGEKCTHRYTISLFAKLAQIQVSTLRRDIEDLLYALGSKL